MTMVVLTIAHLGFSRKINEIINWYYFWGICMMSHSKHNERCWNPQIPISETRFVFRSLPFVTFEIQHLWMYSLALIKATTLMKRIRSFLFVIKPQRAGWGDSVLKKTLHSNKYQGRGQRSLSRQWNGSIKLEIIKTGDWGKWKTVDFFTPRISAMGLGPQGKTLHQRALHIQYERVWGFVCSQTERNNRTGTNIL